MGVLRRTRAAALLTGLALTLAACGGDSGDSFGGTDSSTSGSSEEKGAVTISAQDFAGGQVMAQLYSQLLADAGYQPDIKLVGTRDLYMPGLSSGRIQVVPEYVAGIADFLNTQVNGPDAEPISTNDPQETLDALEPLADEAGITLLEPAAASDQNAFFVTQEFADTEGVQTLSDLAALDQSITLAAPPDCKGRDDCEKGLSQVYGLDITKILPTGFGTTQTKNAVLDGEAQLGETGTTDGSLEQLGLVQLEDDMGIQPAQNLVPAVNSDWLADHDDVRGVLNGFSEQFSTEDLAGLTLQVDVDRADPATVAEEYLTEQGLI